MLYIVSCVTNGQKGPAMTQNVNTVQQDQPNQVSAFRLWVQRIWIDNCEEHLTYNENPYTISEYWNKNKWFLKRLYKDYKGK